MQRDIKSIKEEEGLPGAVAKYYAWNHRKTLKRRHLTERRNLCKSIESSRTASAVVGIEINLPKLRTCTAVLLGIT